MIKKTLFAAAMLALPAVCFVPQGATPHYVPVAQAADGDADVAKAAWAVLEKHCIECHAVGKGKHRASPIDKTTLDKLIEKKHVVPGKPDDSPVYTLMLEGAEEPMPPKRKTVRPTADEVKAIKTWIEKGAPAWPVN